MAYVFTDLVEEVVGLSVSAIATGFSITSDSGDLLSPLISPTMPQLLVIKNTNNTYEMVDVVGYVYQNGVVVPEHSPLPLSGLIVVRGTQGTTAIPLTAGATVYGNLSALMITELFAGVASIPQLIDTIVTDGLGNVVVDGNGNVVTSS